MNPEAIQKYLAELPWGAQKRGHAAQLARDCGVASATVYKWANGMTVPRPEFWPIIEASFGLKHGSIGQAGDATPLDVSLSNRSALATMLNTIESDHARLGEKIVEYRRMLAAALQGKEIE